MTHDGNCDECWAVPPTVRIDAGMFGDKDVCDTCYHEHYKPRPIIARYKEEA